MGEIRGVALARQGKVLMCEDSNTGEADVIHSHLNFFDGSKDFDDNPFKVKIYFSRRKTVVVDKCMIGVIEELNKSGFPTIFSCCGHGDLNPYIVLYVCDKQGEDRAIDIISSHRGNKSYEIDKKHIRWQHFDGYYPIAIRPKDKWET